MAIKRLYISSLASGSLPAARPEAARRLPPGTGCVASALAESGSGTWIHVLAGLAKEELTASCSLTLLTWLDINQGPPHPSPSPEAGEDEQKRAATTTSRTARQWDLLWPLQPYLSAQRGPRLCCLHACGRGTSTLGSLVGKAQEI